MNYHRLFEVPEQYVIQHSFVPLPSVITASNKQQSTYTGDEISVLYFFDGPVYTTPSDNLYPRGVSYDQVSAWMVLGSINLTFSIQVFIWISFKYALL